jgi:inhibitor of cysteine peptidase
LDIANPGTRGEGRWGSLRYDGQKLPRGAINDYYRTPWGPIYWVDVPDTPWGLHGWMPVPLGQNSRQGRPLAVPAALAAGQSRAPSSPSPPASPSSPPSPAAAGKPESLSKQKTLEVTKADSGRRARLYIGNILVVRLPANPGTGYQWQLVPTSSLAVRLMAEPQFVASPAPPGIMGASGTYVFMFQAVRPGTGVVRLVYARPWERDRTAADAFSLSVEVLPGAVSGPGRAAASPAGAVGGPPGPNSGPRGD